MRKYISFGLKGYKEVILLILFLVLPIYFVCAQTNTDTSQQKPGDLLSRLEKTGGIETSLLPDKMVFTQRWLWGRHGLMRNFNAFKLSREERRREMRIRKTMLFTHQILGITTALGMIAQGIIGYKVYHGHLNLLGLHRAVVTGINIGYFSTAAMSLFAPPRLAERPLGFTTIKLHEGFAVIHFSGMIAINTLATIMNYYPQTVPKLKPWHRAAALTTFGAYAGAIITITFK